MKGEKSRVKNDGVRGRRKDEWTLKLGKRNNRKTEKWWEADCEKME